VGPLEDWKEKAMATFSGQVTDVGDVHLVSLAGELDMATAVGLSDWLVELAGLTVVIDLSGVTFLDSSGITALVQARLQIESDGGALKLTRPQPNVERVLEITGLSGWVSDWDAAWCPGSTA
jgi:anti-sigma B factor antagonist